MLPQTETKYTGWLSGKGLETEFRRNSNGTQVFHQGKVYEVPVHLIGQLRAQKAVLPPQRGLADNDRRRDADMHQAGMR